MFFAEQFNIILLTLLVLGVPSLRRLFFHPPSPTPDAEKFEERMVEFDILKGFAIAAVIIIHVVYVFLVASPWKSELLFIWVNNLNRFAIPIFFICSGALLREEKTAAGWKSFFQKKGVRILLPFFLANLILGFSEHKSLTVFVQNLATGKALVPYYFIIVLVQCYLLYPLLVRFRRSPLLLPFAFGVSLASFLTPASWEILAIPTCFQYLFFFIYGVVRKNEILSPQPNSKNIFGWVALIVVDFGMTLWYPGIFYNARFFFGTAIFWILLELMRHNPQFYAFGSRIIAPLGNNSLWIYLTHFPVVFFLFRIGEYFSPPGLFLFVILMPAAILGSVGIGWVFRNGYQKLILLPHRFVYGK